MLEGNKLSKWKKIHRTRFQPILTDVLPHELPIPFQARLLHNFLTKIDLRHETDGDSHFSIRRNKFSKGVKHQIEIYFDTTVKKVEVENVDIISGDKRPQSVRGKHPKRVYFSMENARRTGQQQHPFRFHVRKADGDLRNLSIPHPISLSWLALFGYHWADSILHYTNRSNFSVRHPIRVASLTSGNRVATSSSAFGQKWIGQESVETDGESYENDPSVRSYFKYTSIDFIGKLYNSSTFRRSELDFNFCLKTDISRCFDSLYTHSISWAVHGIRSSKEHKGSSENTFGGKADKLFQGLNNNETNGIVIGPEASRVFAEIILQDVDVRLERALKEINLRNGVNYSAYRYVDDYTFFANNKKDLDDIKDALVVALSSYKMSLNEGKTYITETPFVSKSELAKKDLRLGIRQLLSCEFPSLENVETMAREKSSIPGFSLYFSADLAIGKFQKTCLELDIPPYQVAGYYLYRLLKESNNITVRVRRFLSSVCEIVRDLDGGNSSNLKELHNRSHEKLAKLMSEMLSVAVFVYRFSPSYSNSLKLVRLSASAVVAFDELEADGSLVRNFSDYVAGLLEDIVVKALASGVIEMHDFSIVDALAFLEHEPNSHVRDQFFQYFNESTSEVNGIGILVFIRWFVQFESCGNIVEKLLEMADEIVKAGVNEPSRSAERVLLRNSLPYCPGLDPDQIGKIIGISTSEIQEIRRARSASLFDWAVNENYIDRLVEKTQGSVY